MSRVKRDSTLAASVEWAQRWSVSDSLLLLIIMCWEKRTSSRIISLFVNQNVKTVQEARAFLQSYSNKELLLMRGVGATTVSALRRLENKL